MSATTSRTAQAGNWDNRRRPENEIRKQRGKGPVKIVEQPFTSPAPNGNVEVLFTLPDHSTPAAPQYNFYVYVFSGTVTGFITHRHGPVLLVVLHTHISDVEHSTAAAARIWWGCLIHQLYVCVCMFTSPIHTRNLTPQPSSSNPKLALTN